MHTEFWWGNLKGKDHWEDVDADGYYNGPSAWWEIVEWIHLAQDIKMAGSCEHANKP